ncbi:MAG: glycosyltransferase family 2 protein [Thomasclavelia sp.]
MMSNKIGVGIVTFNPNISKLAKTINTVLENGFQVLIVDNNSKNKNMMKASFLHKDIIFIFNEKNFGIAKALNQIMNCAKKLNIEWMITLDQDSVITDKYLKTSLAYLEYDNVGILCPIIFDMKRKSIDSTSKKIVKVISKEIKEVNTCITSGSITNVKIWDKLNGFNEKLFIDYVDFEYCQRIRKNGYKIYQIQGLFLYHVIGDGKVYKIFNKQIEVFNHSAKRKYYIVRNKIYCDFLNKGNFDFKSCLSVGKVLLITIFFERKKFDKISSITKGIKDGILLALEEKNGKSYS